MADPPPARINLEALRAGMQAADLDLLVAASMENFFYLSGSLLLSQQIIPERLCFAVLARNAEPGIMACYCEETQLRSESWISDIEIYLEHRDSPVEALARFLRPRYGAAVRIGIERRFLATAYADELASRLPAATLVDGDPVFDRARALKTPAEQKLLAQAARDTEQAILDTFQRTRQGDTERQLYQRLAGRVLEQGAATVWLTVAAGLNTAVNHPHPSEKRLEPGDIVRVDVGGPFAGYQSDVARTAVVGTASAAQEEVYRSLRNAERKTISALRPGVTAGEVYLTARDALAEQDLVLTSQAVGHSLGIGLHEHPILHARNDAKLEAGMVFMIEPAVKDERGCLYHLEDMALVTEDEPVILTTRMDTEKLFSIRTE